MTSPEDEDEDLHELTRSGEGEPAPEVTPDDLAEPEWQPSEEDRRVMRGVVPMWSTDGHEV